jgi:hypothetical protein
MVLAAGRRKARGVGNPGKPGKRLRLEDLQSQFGVGLKEAANRLGICPTTLKRACRRHGIQRWPRRQLLKLSKAIDQINATGTVKGAEPGAPGTPGAGSHLIFICSPAHTRPPRKQASLVRSPLASQGVPQSLFS